MHIEEYYRLNMSVNNLTIMSGNFKPKHNKYWDSRVNNRYQITQKYTVDKLYRILVPNNPTYCFMIINWLNRYRLVVILLTKTIPSISI